MTFSDSEFVNICTQLAYLRKDREGDRLARSRPKAGYPNAPSIPGFDWLGAGKDREVWGYGDFAFKLEHPEIDRNNPHPNELEYRRYLEITSETTLPANWHIPKTMLFEALREPVIVMERVTAPLLSTIDVWELIPSFDSDLEKIGIWDCATVNFAYDSMTETIYALDLTE